MGYFGFVIQGWKITHVLFNTRQNNTCNAKQKYNVCKLRLILIVVYTTYDYKEAYWYSFSHPKSLDNFGWF